MTTLEEVLRTTVGRLRTTHGTSRTFTSCSRRWSTRARRDLHITTGSPPQLRIDGELVPLQTDAADAGRDQAALLLGPDRRAEAAVRGGPRARPLVRRAEPGALPRQHLHAARRGRRRVPHRSRSRSSRSTSSACRRSSTELCDKPRGLVLVTGPTGSGKSTTLASMIDKINTRAQRPHHHDRGPDRVPAPAQELPRQPARGRRATRQSFKRALKYILRQDPDVVLIGEMRDLETIEAALTIAETGHLAFAHAAHQLRGPDASTASSTCSRRTSSRRSARSSRSCSRA